MNRDLSPWRRSRGSRPLTQKRPPHLFEALENRAIMAGDFHALHAVAQPHGDTPAARVLQQASRAAVANIPRAGNSGGTATAAPGVPIGVTAEAYASAVRLSWTAPTSTGGSERIGYVVRFSTDAGATWTVVNHRFCETNVLVPMLTNGTSYVFEVATINRAGQSSFSDMSAAVTPVASTTPQPAALAQPCRRRTTKSTIGNVRRPSDSSSEHFPLLRAMAPSAGRARRTGIDHDLHAAGPARRRGGAGRADCGGDQGCRRLQPQRAWADVCRDVRRQGGVRAV